MVESSQLGDPALNMAEVRTRLVYWSSDAADFRLASLSISGVPSLRKKMRTKY